MMFAIKGRLKVALLVIGVLAVVFGMYGAFHPKQAAAHGGWPTFHSKSGHGYKWKAMSQRSISGTCDLCGRSATIYFTRMREECWNTKETYHWIIGWDHRHYLSIKWARYYQRKDFTNCSNSSCSNYWGGGG